MNTDIKDIAAQNEWNDLAKAAQGGDKKAYRRLLSALSPYIQNYLVGSLANPEWAEEITQEALISIHKALKTYVPEKAFKPWMLAIVNFRRTDFLRKYYRQNRNKHVSDDHLEFQNTHVTNPDHAGEYKDVERALQSLPAKQRSIFQKLKIMGFTAKEVAKEMDMSESAVKVSAHRTMAKLKEGLK